MESDIISLIYLPAGRAAAAAVLVLQRVCVAHAAVAARVVVAHAGVVTHAGVDRRRRDGG